jgi:hypothetical protein
VRQFGGGQPNTGSSRITDESSIRGRIDSILPHFWRLYRSVFRSQHCEMEASKKFNHQGTPTRMKLAFALQPRQQCPRTCHSRSPNPIHPTHFVRLPCGIFLSLKPPERNPPASRGMGKRRRLLPHLCPSPTPLIRGPSALHDPENVGQGCPLPHVSNTEDRSTATCVSIDRFLQNTAP